MNKKVVLGLSGGVDSAVAALELVRRGFEVTCLFLQNGVTDQSPARRAAAELDLPFQAADISQAMEEEVCRPFAAEYLAGRTPSPCAVCNTRVKFPALIRLADELGADLVATGHYARVADGPGGRAYLLKGEPESDQSYMLARLTPDQVARCIFPLGGMEKREVRALAAARGLTAASSPDSMELCFVPDKDYAAWLERRGEVPPPGDFVDPQGRVLGRHKGVHHYTVGQGRGLGLSGPHKYYVSAIRREENQVVLTDGADLYTHTVVCGGLNWLGVEPLTGPRVVNARFRHTRTDTPALLYPQGEGRVLAETGQVVKRPAPGQLAVFYEGDMVLGSGWVIMASQGEVNSP